MKQSSRILKNMANIITICRIGMSAALCFLFNDEWWFLGLYLVCGISDVLDGVIARRTHSQTKLGARLDSIADFLFFGVVIWFMVIWNDYALANYMPYAAAIAVIRIINLIIAARKYHALVMLHTWANKLAGLLLFLTPILIIIFRIPAFLWPVIIAAGFAAVEEGIIHLVSPQPDLNKRGLFLK